MFQVSVKKGNAQNTVKNMKDNQWASKERACIINGTQRGTLIDDRQGGKEISDMTAFFTGKSEHV